MIRVEGVHWTRHRHRPGKTRCYLHHRGFDPECPMFIHKGRWSLSAKTLCAALDEVHNRMAGTLDVSCLAPSAPPRGDRRLQATEESRHLTSVSGAPIFSTVEARYARNTGAVFGLKYHLVWCPKYRRPVLRNAVAERLRDLLVRKAKQLEMTIHAMEIMPDHVHLFVEADPRWSVAEIVNRFKGESSHILREEFPHLRSCLPTLWSRSYFAATVGAVTDTAVRKYILSQKGWGK